MAENEDETPKECTVGELRQQTALSPTDRRVVLVKRHPRTGELVVTPYRVVRCYPDTTDENNEWNGGVFKLEIEEK